MNIEKTLQFVRETAVPIYESAQVAEEYVEERKCPPPEPENRSGSVAEAKRIERKRSKHILDSHSHNAQRTRDKLHTKLREFDRHKKTVMQKQSSLDVVFKQNGMVLDFILFGIHCCMVDSVKALLPFALSLLQRYVKLEHFERAHEFVRHILDKFQLQAGTDVEYAPAESIGRLEGWYKRGKNSTLWQTLKELYVYIVSLALHGVDKCNERDIGKMAKNTILKKFEDTTDVVVNIVGLLRKLCTNFYQCVQTGNWSHLFHCEDTYTKWYNDTLEVERIIKDNEIPNNAQDVIERTKQLIADGEEMLKHMRLMKLSKKEMMVMSNRLVTIRELFAKFTGAIVGTQLRRQPFCIFVYGRSKIGKSSFMKANHLLYANLFGKDKTIEPFMRQPGDKHWDGLRNNQWALTYDDVCAHNPNKVMGVEEFCKEFLHVSNCMAKLAECASLEDKGTKPLLFDLLQVSSNVEDLAAPVYFADTAALYRRLQHRVKLEVKPEYVGTDGFLDPSKIGVQTGFPDLWFISVEYATTIQNNPNEMEMGKWEPVPELQRMSAWEYCVWFKARAEEHIAQQNSFLKAMRDARDEPACPTCGIFLSNHPSEHCDLKKQSSNQVEYASDAPVDTDISYEESIQIAERARLRAIDEEEQLGEAPVELSSAISVQQSTEGELVNDFLELFHSDVPPAREPDFGEPEIQAPAGYRAYFHRQTWAEKFAPVREWFSRDALIDRCAMSVYLCIQFQNHVRRTLTAQQKAYVTTAVDVMSIMINFIYHYYWGTVLATLVFGAGPVWWRFLTFGLKYVVLHPFKFLQDFWWNMFEFYYYNALTAIAFASRDKLAAFAAIGRRMYTLMGGTAALLSVVAALSVSTVALVAAFRYMYVKDDGPPKTQKVENENPEKVENKKPQKLEQRFIKQGGLLSVDQPMGDETENVWRKRDYRCMLLDVPLPSSSLKGASQDMIVSYFQRSLVRISFLWSTAVPDRYIAVGGTGFFIGGNKILFMTHFLERSEENTEGIELVYTKVQYYTRKGMTRIGKAVFDPSTIQVFDEQTSIIDFPAMPAQAAMQVNIPGNDMLNFVGPGMTIGRQANGGITLTKIDKIWCENVQGEDMWILKNCGEGDNAETILGDCGSLLLAMTPQGPVLVGLHLWYTEFNSKTYHYNLCGKNFGEVVSAAPPDLTKEGKVGKLGNVHEKSQLHWLDDLEGLEVFGSFDGFRARPKSKVCPTLGCEYLVSEHGFEITHGKPVMTGPEVRFRHLLAFKKYNSSIEMSKVRCCMRAYLRHVLKFRDGTWRAMLLSQKDAINGVPGVRFWDRIPIATSVGFPFRGPKTNFIRPIVPGDWTSTLVVNDEMQEMIDAIFMRWSNNQRASPVFTASLKDEARKFSKIDEKNTRVFFGGPAAFIIAQRMIFSWFTRLVQTHPLIFMQAPGMDANGSQWDLLAKHLGVNKNFIAGDFKDFDISMVIQVLRGSYEFIIELSKHLGADPMHIRMMTVAAEDLINPVVDYFGDLVMGLGKNPSGQALTVHINGIVNALYMLVCYCDLHPSASRNDDDSVRVDRCMGFFDNVRAIFYGDDNLMSVSDDVPWFNHTSLAAHLGRHDVVYTMADKGAESVPYISFGEATFLKRGFRFEPEVMGFVAPLEEASIRKALLLHIPSNVVSEQEAYAQTITGQNDAMWHHGREKFEAFRELLLSLIEHCRLDDYFSFRGKKPLLADYDELKQRWLDSRDKKENSEWVLQSGTRVEHGITHCTRCGRCPFIFDEDDEVTPCFLCGGCTLEGDPWCINCQEDGFCACGQLLEVTRTIQNGSLTLRLFLSCSSCDFVRIKDVALTRTFARENGLRFDAD